MDVTVEPTPNPNAMKFTVGVPVGGPLTVTAGAATDSPAAAELVGIDGVTSIFLTADFVTISKDPDADWDRITAEATRILGQHF